MNQTPKIYIVGGGPAGMMAAYSCKKNHQHADVYLLDGQEAVGKKLKQTGGGRCNVTANMPIDEVINHVPKNGKFLYSALQTFGPKDIIEFFTAHDCPLKIEDHFRMFPVSNNSQDIIDTLVEALMSMGVKIFYECEVIDIDPENNRIFTVNQSFAFDHLILATGGKTLPQTGSNGGGYQLAKKMGHTISPLVPAEVPLVSNDAVIQNKTLQGLSFRDVTVSIYRNNKIYKSITHDLLITHFGLSGPVALRASFYAIPLLHPETNTFVPIHIDFLPRISFHDLENTLLKEVDANRKILQELGLQKRFIHYIMQLAENKQQLIQLIKKFHITIHDTRGFNQAFVTNGGVHVKEINPKTMQSKLFSTISFAGELIDINAFTGGFNITTSFSTGYVAGKNCL